MAIILMLLLAALPSRAQENAGVQPQRPSLGFELDPGRFEDDVESASEKLRKMFLTTRKDRWVRQINSPQRDPDGAQRALDSLAKDDPSMARKQAEAFAFFQGSISFWKGDFAGAHDDFDAALKSLQAKYPDGIPSGKHKEKNDSFLAELYMGRGVTALYQGKDRAAIEDIDRAISISPKPHATMHLHRCQALLRLKQYAVAAQALDEAYGIDAKWTKGTPETASLCSSLSGKGKRPRACGA